MKLYGCPIGVLLIPLFAILTLTGVPALATEETSVQVVHMPPDAQVYRIPPGPVARLIDAPPTPAVSLGPNHEYLLIQDRPSLPPISEVSEPELRIAGLRINPRTNGRSRGSYYTGLNLKRIDDGSIRSISGLPEEARVGSVRWSPDGNHIAFTLTGQAGIELWVAEVANARATRLTPPRLNAAYGSAYEWASDSETLYALFVPAERGERPAEPRIPIGPVIQVNEGRKAPARTYQDLLKNIHDEKTLDFFITSQIVRIDLAGKVEPLGKPGIVSGAEPSPDGRFLLVTRTLRPYSYLVPIYRFPERIEVWDTDGSLVYRVADLPLAEEIPTAFGSVRTGPRSVGWRQDKPATLYWTEAQDGGDPQREAAVRDKVFTLDAPFDGEAVPLASLALRYGGVSWGHDELALVDEWWWRDRRVRTWILTPSKPNEEPEILFDRSWEDRYNDPGNPMSRRTDTGTRVLHTEKNGRTLFLTGDGASEEGNRPFLDRLNLETKKTERLWRSEAPYYEYVAEILLAEDDAKEVKILTRRESQQEQPNYFVRNLKGGRVNKITEFPHPTPQLKDVYKELIQYERADGVKLNATLYLPPGKKPADGPFPMFVMAYPQEFKSADLAGQLTDSPHRFVRVSSHSALLWLVHGYAILDDPTLPIVGEGDEEPNDTFVEQLVAGARAAVDEAVRLGVADRNRVAVGGHSYGAFMTANLLAHSDIFAAGIARSGAYNRTLTPFGFQSEERTLWEAPDIYFDMSPFMHAEKIDEPLLLIHGAADNNSGTYPMQSERFYNALKGHGATARLVMLPHESHGYRSRESVMHMAWEMTQWLDRYVRDRDSEKEGEEN